MLKPSMFIIKFKNWNFLENNIPCKTSIEIHTWKIKIEKSISQ